METSSLEGERVGREKVGRAGWGGGKEKPVPRLIHNEKEQRGFSLAAPAAEGEIKSPASRWHHGAPAAKAKGPRPPGRTRAALQHERGSGCGVSEPGPQPFWRFCELSAGLQIQSCST